MTTNRINIREIALQALLMVNEEGKHSNTVINDALEKYDFIDIRDKSLFSKLIYGTLEYQIQLDYIINKYSKVKTEKMKPMVRNLLRMGVYQILYTDKIPDSAVCDESVKLIKKTALKNLGGFVNGVLRNIARDKATINIEETAKKYSVQDWMIELLNESIGNDKTEDFLNYSLDGHGVSVRKVGTDAVQILADAAGISKSEDFREGRIIVQDLSSTMPVRLSSIKKGDTVIDVCAAPGGKSIQASERVGAEGKVFACDLTEKKLTKIKENIARLHINNISLVCQDATKRNEEFVNKADVVIADLPCSGIGTIGKKPEIKNRLSLDDCKSLAKIQKDILDNVCDYVKTGGELVFSTCTIDHYENEDNTKEFLDNHREFKLIDEKLFLPGEMPQDGFYVALMKKS